MGDSAQQQQGQQQPYNNASSPMGGMNPMNGMQKPLNNGYAGLAPQTGATMMPYQGGMNGMPNYANFGRPMGNNAPQSGMFGRMNPQEQMLNQMRQKEFSGLTPQQQQNATQYGDAYYGQQPSAMTPAQMASSGLSQVPQYAQPAIMQSLSQMQNTLQGTPANPINGLLNIPQQPNNMRGMGRMGRMNNFGGMFRGFGR